MYINSRTVAVQGRVDVYKQPPAPCLCALPGSAQHRDPVPAVSSGHSGTPIVGRDLCEVPIMIDCQSVITCRVVSKMSLVTSLLTTCEICE
ncbi:unnamed protein product [Staurois parvus]|uniref:Uncharacterized protein n=1 Tax=Staurois parvus TaxID=386267 RepID=A0ABN9FB92_9NEOB|nr:unnamed protein product [Staurois parvus]